MRMIAIRHGEVALNPQGRTTGWLDDDLSPIGIQQVHELADHFSAEFDTIISSPLRRTVSTANAIAAKHPCKIVLDPNLRERNFGSLNGKTWDEIESETGKDFRPLDIAMTYDYRSFGGESAEEVFARIKQFLGTAIRTQCSGDLVVVTHGGIIKVLYALLKSEPRHPITNCSVHIFHP